VFRYLSVEVLWHVNAMFAVDLPRGT